MADPQRIADIDTRGGLFFTHHFAADGLKCDAGDDVAWVWRSYHASDLRARQAIAAEPHLPGAAKEAFLSSGSACHVDFESGWLYGDMPDFRHDYSVEAHGLGHFRFAFNETTLIGARKQPLDSVERVRKQIDQRSRAFRTPGELIEAVIGHSLDGMAVELTQIGDALDGIEDRIVCDDWHNERQALVDTRRKLVVIHRQMASLTHLFRHLDHAHQKDLPEGVADMLARLTHRSQSLNHDGEQLQARARLLQDELMAKLTSQTNQLLYILSAMTAVLMPMSIMSGLFGMNVGGIPLGESPGGFWIISMIALCVAGLVLYFVKRLGRSV